MPRLRGPRTAAIAVICIAAVAAASALGASARTEKTVSASGATTFVVANTSSIQKLDPDVITNFLDFQALGLIYDTLVQFNAKLQIVPDLATSWSYTDGNKVLTLQLRKGVTFDDGSPFTSADVVASIERAVAPKTADASSSFLATMKKIVAVGPYTVKLELSRPDTSILDGLTSANFSILPTKAITAGTLAKTPDGTGPYTFVSWTPNSSFVIAANPHYWGGKVTLPQIEIKTIPSEQSIASALEANSVQLGLLTEPQVAEHLPSSVTVQKVLDLSYRALMLQDKTGRSRTSITGSRSPARSTASRSWRARCSVRAKSWARCRLGRTLSRNRPSAPARTSPRRRPISPRVVIPAASPSRP